VQVTQTRILSFKLGGCNNMINFKTGNSKDNSTSSPWAFHPKTGNLELHLLKYYDHLNRATNKRNKKRNNKSTSSLHCSFLCASILYILVLSLNFQHLSYSSWHGLSSHLGSGFWCKKDLDVKIFCVKPHTTLNQQEESRTLIMSKRNQNPL